MNKNDLKQTIKVLNKQQDKPKRGRPVTQFKEISKTSQQGTKENETRATFIVNETILEKVKAIAYWDRLDIKTVVNDALQAAVNKYEVENGPIKSIPKK
jgi:uncharacterized protein with NAD-binding domain and iron-sulfur cluster